LDRNCIYEKLKYKKTFYKQNVKHWASFIILKAETITIFSVLHQINLLGPVCFAYGLLLWAHQIHLETFVCKYRQAFAHKLYDLWHGNSCAVLH